MSESKGPHRILYVSAVSEIGGAEKSLLDILDCLDRSRFEPAVVLPGDGPLKDEILKRRIQPADVRIQRFKKTLNPFKLGKYPASWQVGIRELGREMDRFESDLVHANGDMAQLFAYPAAERRGLPLIWHVRDLTPNRLFRWKLGQHVHQVIAISSAVREMLLSTGVPEDRVKLILNGIDTTPFEALPPVETSCLRVGMIAHLYPWKGHKDFLQMAALVKAAIPEAEFVIAGEDLLNDQAWYKDELHQLRKELGLDEAVDFAGHVQDVPALINKLALLVVPSHGEPFGRCLVEGMASGRPVIAWNTGGPTEILTEGSTGKLIEPYDIDALAEAVIHLMQDRQALTAMGSNARREATTRFHRSRTTSEIQNLYEGMLR
ncbi:MAG: glycosyltransferase family 4 protein [Planctomycetota bacterium]|jgi:glycosyltransferase involved in cell wall biosynthesis|nr:glycosyltransferase family 4 protein [Planctomycetota bacterium]MDP6503771.1 glycosyltransferase family 4 protein [Planctomycetota bacterium]